MPRTRGGSGAKTAKRKKKKGNNPDEDVFTRTVIVQDAKSLLAQQEARKAGKSGFIGKRRTDTLDKNFLRQVSAVAEDEGPSNRTPKKGGKKKKGKGSSKKSGAKSDAASPLGNAGDGDADTEDYGADGDPAGDAAGAGGAGGAGGGPPAAPPPPTFDSWKVDLTQIMQKLREAEDKHVFRVFMKLAMQSRVFFRMAFMELGEEMFNAANLDPAYRAGGADMPESRMRAEDFFIKDRFKNTPYFLKEKIGDAKTLGIIRILFGIYMRTKFDKIKQTLRLANELPAPVQLDVKPDFSSFMKQFEIWPVELVVSRMSGDLRNVYEHYLRNYTQSPMNAVLMGNLPDSFTWFKRYNGLHNAQSEIYRRNNEGLMYTEQIAVKDKRGNTIDKLSVGPRQLDEGSGVGGNSESPDDKLKRLKNLEPIGRRGIGGGGLPPSMQGLGGGTDMMGGLSESAGGVAGGLGAAFDGNMHDFLKQVLNLRRDRALSHLVYKHLQVEVLSSETSVMRRLLASSDKAIQAAPMVDPMTLRLWMSNRLSEEQELANHKAELEESFRLEREALIETTQNAAREKDVLTFQVSDLKQKLYRAMRESSALRQQIYNMNDQIYELKEANKGLNQKTQDRWEFEYQRQEHLRLRGTENEKLKIENATLQAKLAQFQSHYTIENFIKVEKELRTSNKECEFAQRLVLLMYNDLLRSEKSYGSLAFSMINFFDMIRKEYGRDKMEFFVGQFIDSHYKEFGPDRKKVKKDRRKIGKRRFREQRDKLELELLLQRTVDMFDVSESQKLEMQAKYQEMDAENRKKFLRNIKERLQVKSIQDPESNVESEEQRMIMEKLISLPDTDDDDNGDLYGNNGNKKGEKDDGLPQTGREFWDDLLENWTETSVAQKMEALRVRDRVLGELMGDGVDRSVSSTMYRLSDETQREVNRQMGRGSLSSEHSFGDGYDSIEDIDSHLASMPTEESVKQLMKGADGAAMEQLNKQLAKIRKLKRYKERRQMYANEKKKAMIHAYLSQRFDVSKETLKRMRFADRFGEYSLPVLSDLTREDRIKRIRADLEYLTTEIRTKGFLSHSEKTGRNTYSSRQKGSKSSRRSREDEKKDKIEWKQWVEKEFPDLSERNSFIAYKYIMNHPVMSDIPYVGSEDHKNEHDQRGSDNDDDNDGDDYNGGRRRSSKFRRNGGDDSSKKGSIRKLRDRSAEDDRGDGSGGGGTSHHHFSEPSRNIADLDPDEKLALLMQTDPEKAQELKRMYEKKVKREKRRSIKEKRRASKLADGVGGSHRRRSTKGGRRGKDRKPSSMMPVTPTILEQDDSPPVKSGRRGSMEILDSDNDNNTPVPVTAGALSSKLPRIDTSAEMRASSDTRSVSSSIGGDTPVVSFGGSSTSTPVLNTGSVGAMPTGSMTPIDSGGSSSSDEPVAPPKKDPSKRPSPVSTTNTMKESTVSSGSKTPSAEMWKSRAKRMSASTADREPTFYTTSSEEDSDVATAAADAKADDAETSTVSEKKTMDENEDDDEDGPLPPRPGMVDMPTTAIHSDLEEDEQLTTEQKTMEELDSVDTVEVEDVPDKEDYSRRGTVLVTADSDAAVVAYRRAAQQAGLSHIDDPSAMNNEDSSADTTREKTESKSAELTELSDEDEPPSKSDDEIEALMKDVMPSDVETPQPSVDAGPDQAVEDALKLAESLMSGTEVKSEEPRPKNADTAAVYDEDEFERKMQQMIDSDLSDEDTFNPAVLDDDSDDGWQKEQQKTMESLMTAKSDALDRASEKIADSSASKSGVTRKEFELEMMRSGMKSAGKKAVRSSDEQMREAKADKSSPDGSTDSTSSPLLIGSDGRVESEVQTRGPRLTMDVNAELAALMSGGAVLDDAGGATGADSFAGDRQSDSESESEAMMVWGSREEAKQPSGPPESDSDSELLEIDATQDENNRMVESTDSESGLGFGTGDQTSVVIEDEDSDDGFGDPFSAFGGDADPPQQSGDDPAGAFALPMGDSSDDEDGDANPFAAFGSDDDESDVD